MTRTFRVSRIKSLFTKPDRFIPKEEIREQLQEIAKRNPQSASKDVEAEVLLTDRGVEKFKVIVKNRPDVLRKDGNAYYFSWPRYQLEEYFRRFGNDAVIVSPRECCESMRNFYAKALKKYERHLL